MTQPPSVSRRRSLRRLAGLLMALVLAGLALAGTAPSASAYRNPPPKSHTIKRPAAKHLVHASGFLHGFWNYDYDPGPRHVDNPVTIIFISKKPHMVDRVYSQLASVNISGGGSVMDLGGYGGSRPGVSTTDKWLSHSGGRKGAYGCWGHCDRRTDIHVRTYGPDGKLGTQVYQGKHGYAPYYLIATTHFDVKEGSSGERFGYNDKSAYLLVHHMVAKHKWRYRAKVKVPGSSCYGWFDKKHYCDSDGKAYVINID